MPAALAGVAQLVAASSCIPTACGFDPQSGHMFRLQVQSPVGVCMGGNQEMFLSHTGLSLFLALSQINKHILG